MQCCPKSIKTTLNKIFSSAMLCGASWTILHKSFYLCNVVPRVLRQHWTGIFPLQCCLEPLGQHSTKFLPVKCCPKSVKTTLKVIFSCPTFSEASLTKLHKVFTCAMLSQEFWDNIEHDFFLKWKEGARRKAYFYGTELSKNVMKDLTIKKL